MKNLLMFHGSCGHTTVEEVSDEQFNKYATEIGYNAIGPIAPCRTRTGRKTRMVYVVPGRYCTCNPCMQELLDEDGG